MRSGTTKFPTMAIILAFIRISSKVSVYDSTRNYTFYFTYKVTYLYNLSIHYRHQKTQPLSAFFSVETTLLETEISFSNLTPGRGISLQPVSQIVCVLVLDYIRYSFHSTLGAALAQIILQSPFLPHLQN